MNKVNKEILKRAAKGVASFLVSVLGLAAIFGILYGTACFMCSTEPILCRAQGGEFQYMPLAMIVWLFVALGIGGFWEWYSKTKAEVEKELGGK